MIEMQFSPTSKENPVINRLGVIGDLHGEHDRLSRALEWLHGQQLDAIVCTGDIADGRGCINTCCDLLRQAGVLTVAGNHDRWLLEDRVRHLPDAHAASELSTSSRELLASLPRERRLDTPRGELLLCHGIEEDDLAKVWPGTAQSEVLKNPRLDGLLQSSDYRFLINGHMHFRVLIDFSNLLLMNAGTLKGDRAGVSVIDFLGGTVCAFEIGDERAPKRVAGHALDSDRRRVWRDTQEFDGRWTPVTLYA
jgi:predicted phosphodiesterase